MWRYRTARAVENGTGRARHGRTAALEDVSIAVGRAERAEILDDVVAAPVGCAEPSLAHGMPLASTA
jgi:hypothetical protein